MLTIPSKLLRIRCNNWSDKYPFMPETFVRLTGDDKFLSLQFFVDGERPVCNERNDGGNVWEDSCVEFFIQPEGDEGYYNLEANADGMILLAHRLNATDSIEMASTEVMKSVIRKPQKGIDNWSLELIIPISVLFKHRLRSWKELNGARCNLYKCGDSTPNPHFLSLFPIHGYSTPCFHVPESFAPIIIL